MTKEANMKKLMILSGAALMAASSLSFADNGIRQQLTFTAFDINNDGVITQAEAKGRLAKRFSAIDVDNNNAISLSEFDSVRLKKSRKPNYGNSQRGFKHLDINNNGEVTEQEFNAFVVAQKLNQAERLKNRPTFSALDKDGDGELSLAELKGLHKKPKGKGHRSNRLYYPNFEVLDTNADGQLSKEEYGNIKKAKKGQRLAKLDTDKNGSISEQEFNAMLERNAIKRAEREKNSPTFAMLDSDQNHIVSMEEFSLFQKQRLNKLKNK